jgi:hypothetical protein
MVDGSIFVSVMEIDWIDWLKSWIIIINLKHLIDIGYDFASQTEGNAGFAGVSQFTELVR